MQNANGNKNYVNYKAFTIPACRSINAPFDYWFKKQDITYLLHSILVLLNSGEHEFEWRSWLLTVSVSSTMLSISIGDRCVDLVRSNNWTLRYSR